MEVEDKAVGIVTDSVDEIICSKCGCEIDTQGLEPFVRVECPDCNFIETVPTKLGPFILMNLIGTGGMGGVYEARDESLGRRVAIKVMLRSLGDDVQFVQNFKREAQAVARLNHPHITQIYSFGQEKGQPYIVMELVPGERLDKLIETKKTVDPALVMRVGMEIAEGLQAADEAGLVHGDIKPENILLDKKGMAKLVDFGIATVAHQGSEDGIWGTPYYIAPEKVKRQKVDARSDIYSLGATLYHALAGQPPFEGKTPVEVVKARLEHPPTPLREVVPGIDELTESIVLRMLQVNPMKRYPTYTSLLGDMRKVVRNLSRGQAGASQAKSKSGTIRSHRGRASKSATASGGITSSSGRIPPPTPTKVLIRKKGGGVSQPGDSGGKPGASPGPRKTRIVKRSAVKSAAAADAAGQAPGAGTSGKRKAVRKTTSVARTHQVAGTSRAATGSTPRGKKGARKKEEPKKKKKKSKTGLIIFLIMLMLGAGGGGAFWYLKKKEERIARRREMVALQDNKDQAKKTFEEINLAVTNVMLMARNVNTYTEQASNAVFLVTKKPLIVTVAPREDLVAAPPEEPEPEAKAEPEAKPEPKPPPKAAPPPEKKKPADPEAAFLASLGIKPPDELKSDHSGKSKDPEPEPDAAPTADAPSEEPSAPALPAIDAVDPDKAREVVELAREVVADAHRVHANAEEATEIEMKASIFYKEAKKAKVSTGCEARVKKLKELKKNIGNIKSETSDFIKRIDAGIQDVLKIEKVVKKDRDDRRMAREEAERAEKERLAEIQRQKEYEALKSNEMELAATAQASCLEFLVQHAYDEAIENINSQKSKFQTKEGKAAMRVLLDHYTRLKDLKRFLISNINKKPYKWGWSTGANARDVLSANEKAVNITGKAVPWDSVSTWQTMKFVEHYLDPVESAKLSVRVLGQQNLNAAVYCYLNGGKRKAQEFSDRAITFDSRLEDDVQNLLSGEVLPDPVKKE